MSETKNPFACPVEAIPYDKDCNVWVIVPGCSRHYLLSRDQAEYAARAINNYEKLVAERDLYWELSTIQQDLWSQYQSGPNPVGPLNRMKAIRAKLAALLAGETKP